MFFAKKLIVSFLVPPGLFISILLFIFFYAKKSRIRAYSLFMASLLYLFSIEPIKDLFLRPLEDAYPFPTPEKIRSCEAYVVLGSGIREGMPDLSGIGELTEEAYQRTVNAYRAYLLDKKPIILTGGPIYGREAESFCAERFLISLGVKKEHIFLEAKSRDTEENAKEVKEIAEKKKIKRILLVTNAYHMRRSYILFSKYIDVVPFPVGYKTSRRAYDRLSFLPDASNLKSVASAMKEYMGLMYLFFKH